MIYVYTHVNVISQYVFHYIVHVIMLWSHISLLGRPWPNRYSSCTVLMSTSWTPTCMLSRERGFDPELRQYASRVPMQFPAD